MDFLFHALPGLYDHIRHLRDQRRLEGLSDHMLQDVGLARDPFTGQIRQILG
ncbi:hypothetical protein AAFO92_11275 [Roseovarius sp. CAU 1744]|uniref:hypothetical protein n=1 Tax=Roseovarius sp. CAU 1744 TaxID=3140368 RepID=UPI00325C0BC2